MTFNKLHTSFGIAGFLAVALLGTTGLHANPVDLTQKQDSALIITNEPLPKNLKDSIYSRPKKMQEITPRDVTGDVYFTPTSTLVGAKVRDLQSELVGLQNEVSVLAAEMESLQMSGENQAAQYYALVATVNTQLQSGTTPGNPRLEARVVDAQIALEDLAQNLALMNQLAVRASNAASNAAFLQESIRAAYGLSGGIEEDHVHLAQLEDYTYNTVVVIERILNSANDDMTRTSAYLTTERNNLRTLSVAVTNGDLYSKSLSNRPFSNVEAFNGAPVASVDSPESLSTPMVQQAALSGPRALVKIKFDRPDVNYEQALYIAVSEALQRYPNARFDLVAVHPTEGNAAKVAIESTRARRNAERVLRSLTQIGLPADRVDLSYAKSEEARFNEVHLYVR
ncbi:MAG: hypothetical protein LRY76_05255 [Alphaproteobacteria bacterium]|nr:hypothetical protein [Alphaproteobacteria bacterium]MCD8570921.1 hypothetical protein [Alphaproteobacteria bacterium]